MSAKKRGRGRPPLAVKKAETEQPFTFRLPSELHAQLRMYAMSREKRPLSQILTTVVTEWWRQNPHRSAVVESLKKIEASKPPKSKR